MAGGVELPPAWARIAIPDISLALTALAVASNSSNVWGTGWPLAASASLLMNKVIASEVIGKAYRSPSDHSGKVRAVFSNPDVAIAGCVGARDARTMAWWEGAVTWASFTHRYYEYGGGILPAFSMLPEAERPAYARLGEVDTIDGFIMVLSPWAARNLRFDETLGQFHGYDFDICMQARATGRKVVTADLKVWHHHSLELMPDLETWIEANIRLTEKWESRNGNRGGEDWKARARRAEAQASASNVLKISANMRAAARERELLAELDAIRNSASWRSTAPVRRLAALLRERWARRP